MTNDTTNFSEPAKESDFVVPAEVEDKNTSTDAKTKETEPSKTENVDDGAKSEGTDSPVEGEQTPEQKAAAKADQAKARESFLARKAQRRAEDALAQVEALRQELEQSRAAARTAAAEKGPEAPKRPNPKDYELQRWDPKYEADMDEYHAKHEAYLVEKAEHAARSTASTAAKEAAAARENASLAARADDIGKKGVDKYEDFEEVVQDAFKAMPPAPEALRKLVQLENAEDVFYHLGQHPDLLEKITGLDPMGQTLEFGKISARLASAAKVASKVTKAKPTPDQPRATNGQYSSESESRYEKMLKAQNSWN